MRRREFVLLLGGLAASPAAAIAQATVGPPRVGFLDSSGQEAPSARMRAPRAQSRESENFTLLASDPSKLSEIFTVVFPSHLTL